MILRRVISHVRNQEWTAVFLDFVIVVAGVFVATQVTNWNDARKTTARAEVFTARLTEDVRFEDWANQRTTTYYAQVLRNAGVAAAALTGDTTLTDEAFLAAAYRATQYKDHDRARATYEELLSTGEIGLIANDTLREAAIAVFTTPVFDQITEEGIQSEYRRVFRRLVPVDVQRELLRSCGDRRPMRGDYVAILGELDYPCSLDVPPERIARAAAALRSDPTVLPALQLRFGNLESILVNLTAELSNMLDNLRHVAGRGR